MGDKTDGTFQEMSVHDKDNPALPPTVEGQDMSTLDRVIVPMPQFVDPYDPRSQAGSINMDLDDHPMDHSEDYGAVAGEGHQIDSPENVGLRTSVGDEKPMDEWTKADFKSRLQARGLAVSGNLEELQSRWEESEAQEEQYADYNASEWHDDIDGVESTDDLASLRAAYDRSGADYSTVTDHFDEKQSELSGGSGNESQ